MTRMLRFAVPLFLALVSMAAVSSAQEQGRSRSGYLGVSVQDISERLMKDKDLKNDEGAYVLSVEEDSPADSAGLKKGDVVTEFNGRSVYDADDLSKAVSRTKPGTKASITYLRNGQKKSATVVVGKSPRRSFAYFFGDHGRGGLRVFRSHGMLGLGLMEMNDQLAEYFGAPDNQGVLVERVEKDGPAAKAGIKAGDVLLKIGSRTVEDIRDVSRALEKYDEGDKVDIDLLRKGAKKTVTVEVEDVDEGPWGGIAPTPPMPPHMELFRGPGDIDIDIPHLEGLERRIETAIPKIDIDGRKLEQEIRAKIANLKVVREI